MNNEHMAGRYIYYFIGIILYDILVTYTDTIKNTNNYLIIISRKYDKSNIKRFKQF